MADDNVTDDLSANDSVANGFFHLPDLDKVNDAAWNEPDTELIEEVQNISKVIDVRSHGQQVNAHEKL
jgi:hypothetical protein